LPLVTDKTLLIAEADKCVLCGMCLPHCPTYSLAKNENESPRGRLVLGKAFLSGLVEETNDLIEHIEHCLVCRSCESSCPSGVQFGAFMDGLRSHLPQKVDQHDFANILTDQQQRRSLNKKLWLGQKSGLISLGKTILGDNNKRVLKSLPKITRFQALDNHYPAKGTEKTSVMLFTGCNSELLGNGLVLTAIELLTRLGVSVDIPSEQQCCGGLPRHHGDAIQANTLEEKNLSAFTHTQNIPILTLASGCGASLLDYNGNTAESFTSRITDINFFLFHHLQSVKDALKPLNKEVVLHTPCSMKNVLRQDKTITELLALIPGLKVTHLASQRGCCGAAGSYMYEQPDYADALRDPIIDELAIQQADILVTTNIGCAMHIQSGMKQAGLKMNVLHPVELLAKQINYSHS